MILEQAILPVRAGEEAAFEAAFREARAIIAATPGFGGLSLSRCVERPPSYLLLVRWETLESHTEGFRGSAGYVAWRELLHHFYDPFPVVEHYEPVLLAPVMRPAVAADADFLLSMTVAAGFWRPGRPAGRIEQVLADPDLAHCAAGWPRPGDLGVVAELDGQPVGAAWLRQLGGADRGYGWVADDVPEMTLGVAPMARGQGIGSALVGALVTAARAAGRQAISLSVEADNFAIEIYRSAGFHPVGGTADAPTMLLLQLDGADNAPDC